MILPPTVQIIAFELPKAPFFGGTIVVKSTIDTLLEAGTEVIVHAFVKNAKDLNNTYPGVQLYTYLRKQTVYAALAVQPYIVSSRRSVRLIENIRKHKGVLLVEGIHGFHVIEKLWKDLPIILRWHNIESEYYAGLAKIASNWKRIHFKRETNKLRALEQNTILKKIYHVFLNEQEMKKMKLPNSFFVPAFHLNQTLTCQTGTGLFGLFHGKLSIPDNEKAALYIAKNWPKHTMPLIIAGLSPSLALKQAINKMGHRLVDSPDEATMKYLQEAAHIHILWSYQSEGIKLKAVNALYRGRWILANKAVIPKNLESCFVEINKVNIKNRIKDFINLPFGQNETIKRATQIDRFDIQENTTKLLDLIEQVTHSHN